MKPKAGTQYWETLYEHLHRSGWSLGWVSYYFDTKGKEMWSLDAHRGERHVVVQARDLGTAFWQLYFETEEARN